MSQIGGGSFLFLDLLPVVARDGLTDDLVAANSGAWRVPGFVAVAPAGTGDWWAFPVKDASCEESVVFWDHEDGGVVFEAVDFLEFVPSKGLKAGI